MGRGREERKGREVRAWGRGGEERKGREGWGGGGGGGEDGKEEGSACREGWIERCPPPQREKGDGGERGREAGEGVGENWNGVGRKLRELSAMVPS